MSTNFDVMGGEMNFEGRDQSISKFRYWHWVLVGKQGVEPDPSSLLQEVPKHVVLRIQTCLEYQTRYLMVILVVSGRWYPKKRLDSLY
jgi:hypothetical protein